MAERGETVLPFKCGPDYIDTHYHARSCHRRAFNLDPWAMPQHLLAALAQRDPGSLMIVEGAMGALDGAGHSGRGSTADLAAALGLPIVLVIDGARQAHSVTLAPIGLRHLRPDIDLSGVIVNRVASNRHADMIRAALEDSGIRCFGTVPKLASMALPERHLGLHQADEHLDFEGFVQSAADSIVRHVDLAALRRAAKPLERTSSNQLDPAIPPIGQRIAVARDVAFSFAYEHCLEGWRDQGAQISIFSPLADEAPINDADAIYLPGGYPELHAAALAQAVRFRAGMHRAAAKGAVIYGECGGYMTLGQGLTDSEGHHHEMLGLLPIETSIASPRLRLGYRHLEVLAPGSLSPGWYAGHEFHYAQEIGTCPSAPLFGAHDASNRDLGAMGCSLGRIAGSFAHVICASDPDRAPCTGSDDAAQDKFKRS